MTGQNLYDYILRTFKRTDKVTEVYEAITDVVMEIKLQMEAEDFKEIQVAASISVAGEYKFDVPDDFGHLIGDIVLVDPAGGSWPLNKLSKPAWDIRYPSVAENNPTDGVPIDYCLYGNEFYIGPIPDKITYKYQINYTTEEAEQIIAGTAVVPFSEKYRWVLKDLVLARLFADLDDDERAAKHISLGSSGFVKLVENERGNTAAPIATRYKGV